MRIQDGPFPDASVGEMLDHHGVSIVSAERLASADLQSEVDMVTLESELRSRVGMTDVKQMKASTRRLARQQRLVDSVEADRVADEMGQL